MSDEFHEAVVEDFMDEYAAGRTPNPCLRCNEKIKFAAVLDRALALGFDAVVTGHYAQLETGDDGLIEMHRAVDMAKDQSRSEERRVGKECVSPCRFRWSPYH